MITEVFNRCEHKYMLNRETYEKVLRIMDEHMEKDSHNIGHEPYTISNIYYDTPDDFLIRTSLSKPEYKEKLRLRSYGIPQGGDSEVFLEMKKKFKGIVYKRRSKLSLYEAYEFLETGTLPVIQDYMNPQVMRELEYFLKIYDLQPKLYLAYDRVAYFEKNNRDLRVSFDMNIRSRRYDLRLEKGDYGEKLFSEDLYLMEIKTSFAKPLWICDMLDFLEIRRQSFSKYGTEFKNMINSQSQAMAVL